MTVVPIKQAPADPRPMPANADAEGAFRCRFESSAGCSAPYCHCANRKVGERAREEEARDRLRDKRWEALLGATESPIESALLAALVEEAHANGYRVAKTPRGSGTIAIRPQQRVGDYRVDFVVAYAFFGAEIDIVVECDGHDFHEKTKRQAARDKKRDRFLTAQGYRILRFTGSEIFASSRRCASDVIGMVMTFQTECVEIGAGRRPSLQAQAKAVQGSAG